jgi:hypothetical protein
MALPRCPYCREPFAPSRYRPDQTVCGGPDCQRQRRAAYHRKKLQDDASYRAQCRDSQQLWREQHLDYMPTYRKSHTRPAPKTRPPAGSPAELVRLLNRVKNNVAIDLNACPARVFIVSAEERVKNILATAQLVLVEVLPGSEQVQRAV